MRARNPGEDLRDRLVLPLLPFLWPVMAEPPGKVRDRSCLICQLIAFWGHPEGRLVVRTTASVSIHIERVWPAGHAPRGNLSEAEFTTSSNLQAIG